MAAGASHAGSSDGDRERPINTKNAGVWTTRVPATGRERNEMSNKLFVGGLSWNTNDEMLRDGFAQHGAVVEAKVITDRETGRSRGFGFVTMSDPAVAESAMRAMDGASLDGRTIRVNEANERQGGGFGGGGDRGGRGGGRGGRDRY